MENLSSRLCGALSRAALKIHLYSNWGNLTLIKSWLIPDDNRKRILTLYSNRFVRYGKWWFGVTYNAWRNWNDTDYLALLMREHDKCNFVLLNPEEAKYLFSKINPARDDSKKINIWESIPGRIHIQEWQEFPFAERMIGLGSIFYVTNDISREH